MKDSLSWGPMSDKRFIIGSSHNTSPALATLALSLLLIIDLQINVVHDYCMNPSCQTQHMYDFDPSKIKRPLTANFLARAAGGKVNQPATTMVVSTRSSLLDTIKSTSTTSSSSPQATKSAKGAARQPKPKRWSCFGVVPRGAPAPTCTYNYRVRCNSSWPCLPALT